MAENSIDFKTVDEQLCIVIKENIKYMKNKEEYIEVGRNRLFISIILLILSFHICIFEGIGDKMTRVDIDDRRIEDIEPHYDVIGELVNMMSLKN